ncbi:hypothetical protein H2248_003327 [Termitomyces sp. 'cryptogamus']|nr:hypothetical protein H2248_003327 [Termitomyces sp. 'cryptogamus']
MPVSAHLSAIVPASPNKNKKMRVVKPSPFDTVGDSEAIPLMRSYKPTRLGFFDGHGHAANVWRLTPDTVVKITSSPHEVFMMEFASSQTSIPIPKIRKCVTRNDYQYLFMECIEGDDLYEIWPSLSSERKYSVACTLQNYVQQLRAVKLPNSDVPGPIQASGEPLRCEGHHFPDIGAGPFPSYTALTAWYNGRSRLNTLLCDPSVKDISMIPESKEFFDDSMPLVFTHGDLSPANIRIGKDGTVWLIDWERAGAYPQWFEYANMMAYATKSVNKLWPAGWGEFIPLIAGQYEVQLDFLKKNFTGIAHYAFDGFD